MAVSEDHGFRRLADDGPADMADGGAGGGSARLQPLIVFRSALAVAVAKERASRARRPERVAAVGSLTDADQAHLVEMVEAEVVRDAIGPGDAHVVTLPLAPVALAT
jgi:hypothetical protein